MELVKRAHEGRDIKEKTLFVLSEFFSLVSLQYGRKDG